jgi:hypothetical protein
MPVIGYGYEVIKPQYKANLQNVDLIAKVLLTKQQEYNTAYAGLQDLQKTAIGINFLNKGEQAKIDKFNQKVNQSFDAGEFGDLSDPRVADRYYSMFDEIGNDSSLISRYKQDASYQDQLRAVEQKRQSKDPAKAGFGVINYDNYLSRVQEYANLDLNSPDAQGFVLRPYTDYVDMNKELGDRMKNVPIKKFNTVEVKNGYMRTTTYEGRDPDAVGASTQEFMSDRGVAQLREQAEYTWRKAKGDPQFQQAIYADHVRYNTQAQKQISDELTKTSEDLKSSTDPKQIADLSGKQARLEAELGSLKTSLKSADEYFARDQGEIINDMASVALQDTIEGAKTAFGGYATSEKIEPDRAYLEAAKMQQHAQEFKLTYGLKEQELVLKQTVSENNDENAKLKIGAAAKTATQGTVGVPGSSVQPSYFSTSDVTHVDLTGTSEAMNATLTKLYAKQSNILESGITHGDKPISGEDVGLQLAINPNVLDGNEFYSESPYLAAYKYAWDDVHRNDTALSDYLGKAPSNNYEWDRLKEANAKVKEKVNQMMQSPQNREESQFANALQDVNANLESVTDFMAAANKSGNPAEYIKNATNVKMFSNAAYDFELPDNPTKEQKQQLNNFETLFKPTFVNNMGGPDEKSGTQVKSVNFSQIARIETGPDGTVKVFPKASAFTTVTKGSGDDKEVLVDKTGFLSAGDGYILARDGSNFKKQTVSDIKTKGYFELKDRNFNITNWGNQLGYTVGPKPQTRWDASSDGQSVPFKTRRSTITNMVEAQVNGGTWQKYPTSDVTAVIAEVRKMISSTPYAELVPKTNQ